MGSIRRHRNAMTALLAEYNDRPSNSLDNTDDFDDYLFAKKRREDNDLQGGLCQSIVRYARPQKARSASGEWKYIVNTGQHTQTLRLEKCMNPQESCSYLAGTFRSHCAQVYNYHRLLSWDKTRGLHVDIFKVPTCCSCQIDGYKQQFPALGAQTNNDFTPVYKEQMYRQYQQLDYHDEEEEDEDDYNFSVQHQQHKHDSSFDADELSSNKIRNKVPSPTVGSYLSPPGNKEYDQHYLYKTPQHSSSVSSPSSNKYYTREVQRKRPHKSYSDSRSDQEYSPSEEHAEREVNKIGTLAIGKDESNHQNQKNIYSVTHTASTGSSGFSDSSTTAISASTGTIRAVTTPSTNVYRTRNRRPANVDTNAHQKPSVTATTTSSTATAKSSSAAAITTTTTTTAGATTLSTSTNGAASLPTHYYTRSRHVLKNQSRLRIPYTITSTHPRNDSGEKDYTETTSEFGLDDTTTSTEDTSSSQPPNVYAVNPEIFRNHYKTKFNLTYTTAPTFTSGSTSFHPSPPKRINYSYHPIIDFFEYNRRVTASATTTTPQPFSSSSSRATATESSTKYLSSTHLYPHKILKSKTAPNYQQTQVRRQQEQKFKQQLKYRPQLNERRIGYGAASPAAAVAAATDGDGSSESSGGVVFNNPQLNTHTPLKFDPIVTPSDGVIEDYDETLAQEDVWHPVIVHDF